jgi:hypothetical protein
MGDKSHVSCEDNYSFVEGMKIMLQGLSLYMYISCLISVCVLLDFMTLQRCSIVRQVLV